MQIPFVDLHVQYRSIQSSVDAAISNILSTTTFVGGAPVKDFEAKFADFAGATHCIGVGNGTDAIYAVMKCLGIGPGDEVITVANSWISTSETISQTGATPVFVDVDAFFHIDVEQIAEKVTSKTKAVLPVHLYGQAAAITDIAALCEEKGLYLIEDCAQAHGATYADRPVGTFGIAGTFSFYPGKNLGAYGDAGAIITSDDDLAHKVRMFCNHGAARKHHHEIEGINSRLDSLQAAVLSVKLPYLNEWTSARQKVAEKYYRELCGVDGISLPKSRNEANHVYHLFVVKTYRREEMMSFLDERGVATQIHYPTALPLLPAYERLGYCASEIPIAAANQEQILSLPIYPELSDEMVTYVCDQVRNFEAR